jgi:hypothetical protein
MTPVLKGKSIGSDQKTELKGELLIWRTNNEARDQGIVQLKDSICFKSVDRNWFLGNWTLDPRLKWASGMHLLGTSWNILYFVRRVVTNLLLRVKPLRWDAAAC